MPTEVGSEDGLFLQNTHQETSSEAVMDSQVKTESTHCLNNIFLS